MKKRTRLILEFSEFNAQRFNSNNTDVSIGLAPDKSLSVNAFDRHEDSIRTGMGRINNIMRSLSNTTAYKDLKSKLTFEHQKPSSLKVLRIIPNNTDYYVYITFNINENEYNGVLQNVLGNTKFISNVFQDEALTQSEEWRIRLRGLITESFKNFLNIEPAKYKILNKTIRCFNTVKGDIKILKEGDDVEVIKTLISENKIIIKHNNDLYNLTKDDYVYFNYWFEKI